MNKKTIVLMLAIFSIVAASCKKEKNEPSPAPQPAGPKLIIKVRFDSTQVRLDNFGNPSTIPLGNAAQSPVFFGLSAHFIELSPNSTTAPGSGEEIYKGVQTSLGGAVAAEFDQAIVKGNNETFVTIPISSITPGTYNFLRASVTYQNYDIKYHVASTGYTGRLSSFVGWNTYLTDYLIKTQTVTVNANKLQGYFAVETFAGVMEGQTPAGATTVPNPIAATSPIPAGSCLVTGQFASPLTITGSETSDITIVISLSTNKSFEWKDDNGNGLFEPLAGDTVVNMGLRGLIPIVE
jgi:hypothetical protein